MGTYMATFHKQGIRLWGGTDFKVLAQFQHDSANLIDFSPKERFLVTCYTSLSIWDVKSKQRIRSLPGGPTPEHGWPVLKWSYDEAYLARVTEDNIHIFDTLTMKLITPDPKKPTTLFIPRVRAFDWSPSDLIFSYWVPEEGDKPARVVLVRLVVNGDTVQFEQLTQKNLFRVVDIKMHWQSQGEFLCVKVDRYSKSTTTKEKVTNFELFRMKAKAYAVDVVELTEEVIAFAWEPKGLRFAVIHGDNPQRYSLSFYTMGNAKTGQVKLLKSFPKKQANHLFWSPRGTHIVVAGLKSFNGVLEFWNVQEMELTGGGEHFMCTDVEWDPSGRYVTTSVSYYLHNMENGYTLWTFQGKQYLSLSRDKFYLFQWRPRPPSVLDDKRLKVIQKQLKERVAKYQEADKAFEKMEADNLSREKREKMETFRKFLADSKAAMRHLTDTRRAQRKCGWDSEDESCYRSVETNVEEVITIEEEEL